jgi:hypothetical protein
LDRRLDEPQNRLVDMERRKIFPLLRHKLWPLGHPAYKQLLCWLHYPGSNYNVVKNKSCSVVHCGTGASKCNLPLQPEKKSYKIIKTSLHHGH